MSFPAICTALALGVNTHVPPNDTLDLVGELGTGWIRIDFNWDLVEPQQGQIDYSLFDTLLDEAKARNLKVFATIGYGAAWASVSGDKNADGAHNDVPNATEFRRFVRDSAARYADGRVAAWGTWNEPNLGDFFEGSLQEWLDNVFTVSVDAIEEGCPSCSIVGPELASIGSDYATFLEAALDSRGSKLDAVSFHIYASFPEDDDAAGKTKDSFYNKLEAHRVIDIGGNVVYEGPLSVREVLVAKGYSSLPVWITETGREARLGYPAELTTQSRFVERVLIAQYTRPWWEKTFFYEITEEHPGGLWPDIHWGFALRTSDPDDSYADNFERKPVFDDLKGCIAAGGGGGIPGLGGSGGSPAGGAGAGGDGGGGPGGTSAGGVSVDDDEGSCGCRVGPSQPSTGLLALLAGLGLFRWRRRRS